MKQVLTPALLSVVAGLAMPLLLGWLASRRLHVHEALDRMRIPVLLGALVTVPVSLYEHVVLRLLGAAPSPSAVVLIERFAPDEAGLLTILFRADVLRAGLGAALPEELLMAACLYGWLWFSRRRRHAAKEIILGSMAVALAFAAIENALFLQNMATALRVLVLRSLVSTPEHAANGFGLGIFAALAWRSRTRARAVGWAVAGIVLALASHALYDAVVMVDATALRVGLVLPVGGLAIICLALAAALGLIVGPALYGLHRLSHSVPHRHAAAETTP